MLSFVVRCALLTQSLQWSSIVQGAEAPEKHFDRTTNLSGTQIISYRTSADGKWSTLVGIAPGSGEKYASFL